MQCFKINIRPIYRQGILAKTLEQAGEDEKRQVLNVAQAAAVTPTLTHFICSALPPAAKVSDGKLKVAHFDYKADAIDHIEQHLPELYAKMTQLWVGWYASNMFNEYLTYLLPIVSLTQSEEITKCCIH